MRKLYSVTNRKIDTGNAEGEKTAKPLFLSSGTGADDFNTRGYRVVFNNNFENAQTINNEQYPEGVDYSDSFVSALTDWQCTTELNFELKTNTDTENVVCGNRDILVSIVDESPEPNSSDALAGTKPFPLLQECAIDNIDVAGDFLNCAEIIFYRNKIEDANFIDILSPEYIKRIALHELGHAHFLEHVAEDTELMWFNSTESLITPNALAASDYIQDFSEVHNCDVNPDPDVENKYKRHTCFVGLNDVYQANNGLFSVYAANNEIDLFNENVLKIEGIEVFNINGTSLFARKLSSDERTIRINHRLSSGVFIMVVTDNEGFKYPVKFIKI